MTNLVIRPASIADYDRVCDLLQRSYAILLRPDYAPDLLGRALPVMTHLGPEVLASGTYALAEQDGTLRAVAGWSDSSPFGRAGVAGHGHIRHVAVDPDCLQTGLARLVFDRVVQTAGASGVELLHCLSTRTAMPFFRAMGFDASAEVDMRLTPELYLPVIQMRLVLRSAK